jgi:hypothetical protein
VQGHLSTSQGLGTCSQPLPAAQTRAAACETGRGMYTTQCKQHPTSISWSQNRTTDGRAVTHTRPALYCAEPCSSAAPSSPRPTNGTAQHRVQGSPWPAAEAAPVPGAVRHAQHTQGCEGGCCKGFTSKRHTIMSVWGCVQHQSDADGTTRYKAGVLKGPPAHNTCAQSTAGVPRAVGAAHNEAAAVACTPKPTKRILPTLVSTVQSREAAHAHTKSIKTRRYARIEKDRSEEPPADTPHVSTR